MRSAAAVWRTNLPSPAGADRRMPTDRRTSTHSGRRSTDPSQICSVLRPPGRPSKTRFTEGLCGGGAPACGPAITVMLQEVR